MSDDMRAHNPMTCTCISCNAVKFAMQVTESLAEEAMHDRDKNSDEDVLEVMDALAEDLFAFLQGMYNGAGFVEASLVTMPKKDSKITLIQKAVWGSRIGGLSLMGHPGVGPYLKLVEAQWRASRMADERMAVDVIFSEAWGKSIRDYIEKAKSQAQVDMHNSAMTPKEQNMAEGAYRALTELSQQVRPPTDEVAHDIHRVLQKVAHHG